MCDEGGAGYYVVDAYLRDPKSTYDTRMEDGKKRWTSSAPGRKITARMCYSLEQ